MGKHVSFFYFPRNNKKDDIKSNRWSQKDIVEFSIYLMVNISMLLCDSLDKHAFLWQNWKKCW